VGQYQKGKTNLDFTEARDSEWHWHQLGHMQVCTSLQADNMPVPHCSVFYRPEALPAAQLTVSKLLMAMAEVFNLRHAVDSTEIPSSGGGPHGPRRTGFNLSYSWLGQNMSY